MHNPIVYTITVIDMYTDPVLGIRRTPAIFTDLEQAIFAVKNNIQDISDSGTFQYAVIEETTVNIVRPNMQKLQRCWWYKYNAALDEFVQGGPPAALRYQTGFGIG